MNKVVKILSTGILAMSIMMGGAGLVSKPVSAAGSIEERLAELESKVNGLWYDVSHMSMNDILPMRSEQEALWRYYNNMTNDMGNLKVQTNELYVLIEELRQQGGNDDLIMELLHRIELIEQGAVSTNNSLTILGAKMRENENGLTSLNEWMENLRSQATSSRENMIGLSAQVQSLLNRVEALSKTVKDGEEKMTDLSNERVVQVAGLTGVGGWGGVSGLQGVATVTGNKADNDTEKRAEEKKDEKKVAQSQMEERTSEVTEVPELGEDDERANWWWMLPVMIVLGVGVVAWWVIPKILAKNRG